MSRVVDKVIRGSLAASSGGPTASIDAALLPPLDHYATFISLFNINQQNATLWATTAGMGMRRGAVTDGFIINLDNSASDLGGIRFTVYVGGVGTSLVGSSSSNRQGTLQGWKMIACVVDNGVMSFYINGKKRAQRTYTNDVNGIASPSPLLLDCGRAVGAGGSIHTVEFASHAIYNVALTPEEIFDVWFKHAYPSRGFVAGFDMSNTLANGVLTPFVPSSPIVTSITANTLRSTRVPS